MFKTISAYNLFSWQDLEYEIKPGVSQITGFNFDDNSPEGCGKSSIPNILSWVLYGKIPKDAKVDEVIREGANSGGGTVKFLDGSEVSRSRKPNDLHIRRPDGTDVRGKDAKETQLLVNNLVGLDFEAFCQTIYFAQNYPKKFVAATDTEKVAILSQVLDLTVFDKARKRTQDLVKKAEGEFSAVERQQLDVQAEVRRYKSNADLLVQFIERFEAEKEAKASALTGAIETLDAFLESLNKLPDSGKTIEKDLAKAEKTLEDLSNKKVQLETSIRLAENAVKSRKNLENTVAHCTAKIEKATAKLARFGSAEKTCPTCGEDVKAHKIGVVFKELKELETDIQEETEQRNQAQSQLKTLPSEAAGNDCKRELVELHAVYNQAVTARKGYWDKQSELKRLADKAATAQRDLTSLKKQLAQTEASACEQELVKLGEIDDKLTTLEATERQLADALAAAKTKMDNLDILKTGFKEVKQFVFQALLNELSIKSTKMAQELFEVPVTIKFSNEDDEGGVTKIVTTVTLDGNERSLSLYSGGQNSRIQLAVDLSLASIVGNRSQSPIKFRILDEPFKDLSEGSCEKVVKLLEKLEGPTIIIEHNSITKSIIANVFDIEYRDGVSHAS